MNGPLHAFRLDDRVVVITGASSGLGLGFARAVAAVGGILVLGARRVDRLRELAAELRAQGATVLVQALDVTVPEQCQALVDAAVASFGRVDVLVNNAGLGGSVPASRETPDGFRQVIDVNLNGSFWMAQACARVMPPGSSIVNVASVHGVVASRYPGASYAASKAGVIGLTRDLAQQWSRRKGIRVNALCPGYVATEMTTAHGEDELREMVAEHSLLGRFGEQAEVDGALLFLAAPASSYVTGTTLVVDGGLSATV
ncbi:SDR family NAD(P)-dependent oxidoreductase [Dactylosporangium matsuzakiense]|uniref:Short-chain dehydrogenase n=1 Tax=Dactylosporangium matsuzakiense TaxID=53360 RepID=A0A9W6NIX0_9ACTN|nr:SDR family oxidoreductase [Dactylosporangium matsuzakiense]UWZ47128.1 SDR family oxidoreductase [Dactylosporangium matsuzakiense]GLK98437.1 short-chain dehydrogenase [Dactylosporangium matsuzakiense]